jgi:hypothetical protein
MDSNEYNVKCEHLYALTVGGFAKNRLCNLFKECNRHSCLHIPHIVLSPTASDLFTNRQFDVVGLSNLKTLPEDGNVMPKHVGATIHN